MPSCATAYMNFFCFDVLWGNAYINFFDDVFIPGFINETVFMFPLVRIFKWYFTWLWSIVHLLCCTVNLWWHAYAINLLLELLSLLCLPCYGLLKLRNNVHFNLFELPHLSFVLLQLLDFGLLLQIWLLLYMLNKLYFLIPFVLYLLLFFLLDSLRH